MIEGLKVTISGTELQTLCTARADYHAKKAAEYRSQLKSLHALNVEGSSARPGDAAERKIQEHDGAALEMRFIAKHLYPNEQYLLNRQELYILGCGTQAY